MSPGLSPFVAACFTLNYIIGTGFLTLPWAFERAGLGLSVVVMVCVCFISNTGSDYLLSAMARAESYTNHLERKSNEKSTLLQRSEQSQLSSSTTPLLIKERKFEIPELCSIFLGDTGLKCYGVAVVLDIYGFLWAYASVFASSFSTQFPLFGDSVDSYPFYLLVFAFIVLPLSLLELSEQATFQVFLSGCRILMILLMVGTTLYPAFLSSASIDDDDDTHSNIAPPSPSPQFGEQTEPIGAPLFDKSNIHEMIPILVFAVLFHQAVPGLADEMTEKSKVGQIFAYTFILCGVAYSLIGLVVGFYFGDSVHQSSNLNWLNYHGGTGEQTEDGGWINVSLWARAISFFVLCFPAIDVVSAFPLYAYTLGNSIMGILYSDRIREVQHEKQKITMCRLIAALPPIIGALFVRELGIISDYSGISGLAIAFLFPALLYIRSEEKLQSVGLPSKTHYERIGSSILAAKIMLGFGTFTIVFCFALLAAKG